MDAPLTSLRFTVELGGIDVAGFSEVSGLGAEVAVIEYRDGADVTNTVRKIPGLAKYSNVTLKRGIVRSDALWSWIQQALRGSPERRDVAIRLLNQEREPVWSARLANAWPRRYEGPVLNASGNEVAIETLELTHEGLDIETG